MQLRFPTIKTQASGVRRPQVNPFRSMSITSLAALLLWPLVTLFLFLYLPSRRAIVYAFVIGFLFLPWTALPLPGLPDYGKSTAVSVSCLICAALFDPSPLSRLRPSWVDLLPALGVAAWFASSIGNGHGLHDALSASLTNLLDFAVPYLLGRAYLGTPDGLREIARGMLVGFALYLPLIVFEFRFSAMLNYWIYGISSTAGHAGLGVRRAAVFLYHGLALSSWIGPLAALAVWMAIARCWKGVWLISAAWIAALACVVTVLCHGRGSIALMVLGGASAVLWRLWRTTSIPLVFSGAVVGYLFVAFVETGVPIRSTMVELSASIFGDGKAGSLEFRLKHEAVLVWNTLRNNPLTGFGGWGGNRDLGELTTWDMLGRRELITDGLWIIIFSNRGFPGLISVWGWMLIPGTLAVLAIRRVPLALSTQGLILGLATWSFLLAFDCLLNAFWINTQPLLAGAFTTFVMLCNRMESSLKQSRRGPGNPRAPSGAPRVASRGEPSGRSQSTLVVSGRPRTS